MQRGRSLFSAGCLLLTALPAAAQVPAVREINVYGLRKATAESVLKAAKLRSGEALPPSKGDIEEAIEQIPGVLHARVEAVCCQGKNAVLFVGIEEREGPHVAFRPQPSGTAAAPEGMMEAYRQFLDGLRHTGQQPKSGPQTARDPALSAAEEKFVDFATTHQAEVRDVLYNGAEGEERAAAAIVIGYAANKREILPDLDYALRDPDEAVRSNAIRSLHAALLTEEGTPEGLPVPLGALTDLVQSIVLSDRLEAVDLLVSLTEDGNKEALALLRTRALRSLVEMARWESLHYALPPYILVGRMAGFSEQDIQKWWSSGEREHVIQRALALARPTAPAAKAPAKKR